MYHSPAYFLSFLSFFLLSRAFNSFLFLLFFLHFFHHFLPYHPSFVSFLPCSHAFISSLSFPSFPQGKFSFLSSGARASERTSAKKARARKKSKRGKIDATLMLKKEEEKGTNYSELLTCWPVCLSVCLFVCLLRPSICWYILLIWYFHNRRGDSKSFATIFSLPKRFCIFFFLTFSFFFLSFPLPLAFLSVSPSLFSDVLCSLHFGCPFLSPSSTPFFSLLPFFLFGLFYDFVSEDRLIFPGARNFPGQKPRRISARPRDGRARS